MDHFVSAPVLIYTGPDCQACYSTKRWLAKHGIDFEEVDVRADETGANRLHAMGITQLPVVVAGSMTWSGFRIDKLRALAAATPQEKEK